MTCVGSSDCYVRGLLLLSVLPSIAFRFATAHKYIIPCQMMIVKIVRIPRLHQPTWPSCCLCCNSIVITG